MRIWHYKLIPFLPNSQLVAQWRELNCIFNAGKERINHILINYVKDCSDEELYLYTVLIERELWERNIQFKETQQLEEYFKNVENKGILRRMASYEMALFPDYHTKRYLLQCFFNLQEKYDRGQKDFNKERYEKMEEFVKYEIH